MNLKVIGTGFGRTGSHSLKLALEVLGLGPCYHMMEVFGHPGHGAMWDELGRSVGESRSDQRGGTHSDFEAPLAGFTSTVDWPTTFFWRELMARNPDAKILHSERPSEEWYQSISSTILPSITRKPEKRPAALASHPDAAALGGMFKTLIIDGTFGGDLSKENVIRVYERHNADVRAAIPKERLLVFNAREGWEPLCRFLGIAVPAEPYPKVNSTDEFRARAGL
jgi:hypothetical protein